MRQVSLREFRTRGAKALKAVPAGETVLLAGQQGPAYFLIPVQGDVIAEDRELRLAMARASLRAGWERINASQLPTLTAEEIDREIAQVRKARLAPKRSPRR
jgi:antitoxin (DNA-binding transcriptional repressor) of toxin-antitoxin stability system